mmetsp:Transcript_16071/g.31065  ORF Transcript_16071/g.31065 Transcript_16071/m.31065 type:complete len:201 (-) Transcript_16071:121-723(-)
MRCCSSTRSSGLTSLASRQRTSPHPETSAFLAIFSATEAALPPSEPKSTRRLRFLLPPEVAASASWSNWAARRRCCAALRSSSCCAARRFSRVASGSTTGLVGAALERILSCCSRLRNSSMDLISLAESRENSSSRCAGFHLYKGHAPESTAAAATTAASAALPEFSEAKFCSRDASTDWEEVVAMELLGACARMIEGPT